MSAVLSAGVTAAPVRVVLDTNIVLDLWLYKDAATPALLEALETKSVQWLATQVMRDELERVLAYSHIVKRLAFSQLTAEDILASGEWEEATIKGTPPVPHRKDSITAGPAAP